MTRNARKPAGKTRYQCRRCGNSAMFVYEGQAKVSVLRGWGGRTIGYRDLADPVVEWERVESRPSKCWVCGSHDLTHATRKPEEADDAHEER